MFILGITGGIGTGKSTVSRMLSAVGLSVIDADQISHDVTADGGRALPDIRELLGDSVFSTDGELYRPQVAGLIFQNHRLLDRYSYLVHRHIFAEIEARLAELEKDKVKACVLDVPIPVKEGFLDRCSYVIAIETAYDLRMQRLIDRGMELEDAKRRIQSQLLPESYRDIANMVLENNGTEEELYEKLKINVFPLFATRGIRLQVK